ncbi:MAG: tetratricopeptide repeat protein [Planctomycetota bacterium]|jgi:tetratricopeptide (TPR) repeat protein
MRYHLIILLFIFCSSCPAAQEEGPVSDILYPASYTGGEINKAYLYWLSRAAENSSNAAGEAALQMANTVNRYDLKADKKADEILKKIIAQEEADPFVKDLAVQLYSEHLINEGEFKAGEKLQLDSGVIDKWFVCGPFGRYAYSSFYRKYGPEAAAQPADYIFTGSRNKVSWRQVRLSPFDMRFYPYSFIYPVNNVTLYAAAQFISEKKNTAVIEIDTKASYRLWLNGKSLADKDNIKNYAPRRKLIKSSIRKGSNLLFLKIYSPDSSAALRIRMLDRHFKPLPGISFLNKITPEKFPFSGAASTEKTELLAPRIERYCKNLTKREKLLLKSFFMSIEQIPDLALHYAEEALKSAPANVACRYRYADAVSNAIHLPTEIRSNLKRKILKDISAKKEHSIPALLRLADLERDDEKIKESIALLDRILAIKKDCIPAFRRKAGLFLKEKWYPEAEKTVVEFLKYFPENTSSAISASRVYQNMRLNLQALEKFSMARRLKQSSSALWWIEIEALTGCGKIKEAETLLSELLKKTENIPVVNYSAAEAYLKISKPLKALGRIELACRTLPQNEIYQLKKAEILYQLGRTRQALTAYRKSLELKPSQHYLRRLIDKLEGKNYNFWQKYRVDVKEAIQRSRSNRYIGGTVRLIDQTVMSIYKDGSRAESIHQLQKVLTRGGISTAAEVPVIGDLLEARSILNENTSLEPVRVPEKNSFTMPGLRENTCVEYRFFLAHKNHYDYTFHAPCWYFRSPDSNEKFVLTQYIIEMPEDFPFKYVQRNFKNAPKIETAEGKKTYTWTMRNMERVANEEGMPHIREFLPHVEIGADLSWSAMAELFANFYLSRLQPTLDLKNLIKNLIKESLSEREKIKILHRYVMDNIENTSSGNRASIINARKKGNRILLLLALLKEAGVKAEYALLRPGSHLMFEPSWDLPQPDIFLHRAIAVFPKDNSDIIWLDMRYRDNTLNTIHEDFSNATAFVVNEKGGEFFTLPGVPAQNYAEKNICTITLDKDSSNAVVQGENKIRGKSASLLKEALLSSSKKKRIQSFERRMNNQFNNFTTTALVLPNLEKPGTEYLEKYNGEISRLLLPLDESLYKISLPLTKLQIVKDIDSKPEERKNPYRINSLYASDDIIIFNLPEEYKISRIPENVFIKSELGSYLLKYSISEKTLTIKRKYTFEPKFIKKDKFAELVEILRKIRDAEEGSIILEK